MENIEEKDKEAAVAETPKGRAAWLARYRGRNPEAGDEVDDEALWNDADESYADIEGKYGRMSEANSKLTEHVSKDPKMAAVLSMVAGDSPKSLPYAVGSVYGRDFLDGDLEEFEAGYQEQLQRLAESQKMQEEAQGNIEKSIAEIERYGKENGLDEEKFNALYGGIMNLADNLLMGKIPAEIIDLVYKGLNYEQDVQQAADTGFVEGKNENVSARMKKTSEQVMPDLGGAASRNGTAPKPAPGGKKKGSFFDGMKEVKY